MRYTQKARSWLLGMAAVALVVTSCGGGASAGAAGSNPITLRISGPADGADVSTPFTVTVDASVPLDDPETGEHHVHLCFDGADCDAEYQLAYGNTFEVRDLPPGEHTIEASLRNADHSDAGVTDEITVNVTDGANGSGVNGDAGGATDAGRGY